MDLLHFSQLFIKFASFVVGFISGVCLTLEELSDLLHRGSEISPENVNITAKTQGQT